MRLGRGIFAMGALLILKGSAIAGAGIAPTQPIPFNHETHVGKRQISCVFCHPYAAEGPHAGIPSLSTCADCHRVVWPSHPDVIKVMQAYQNREPIRWVRVTYLPDFVRFTHRRHVKAGIACQTCHGDLGTMPRVYQARSLNMGDCLSCHRQNNAPTDCLTCHY